MALQVLSWVPLACSSEGGAWPSMLVTCPQCGFWVRLSSLPGKLLRWCRYPLGLGDWAAMCPSHLALPAPGPRGKQPCGRQVSGSASGLFQVHLSASPLGIVRAGQEAGSGGHTCMHLNAPIMCTGMGVHVCGYTRFPSSLGPSTEQAGWPQTRVCVPWLCSHRPPPSEGIQHALSREGV